LNEKNTQLETQFLHQKAQLEQWESRWKTKEEEEIKRSSIIHVAGPSTGSYNYSEFAKPPGDEESALVLHTAKQSQIDIENHLIAAETALTGEKHQRSIVQSQLSSAQKTFQIKEEQYQHRIQFFEEQVRDLEQQLSSLYTAFGIMQDDNKEERSEMEVWRKSLFESDAALAKEQAIREAKKFDASDANQQREMQSEHQIITHHKSERGHRRTVKKGSRRSVTKMTEPPSSLERTTVATGNEPIAKGVLLLLIDNEGKPLPPNKIPSPSTPRQRSFLGMKTTPLTSDVSNKLKKQFCVLHGANGLYQLRYGDSYSGPVSGVHEFITARVSSVEVSRLICSHFHHSKTLIHMFRI
jgi:hypothetical protein